MPAAINTLDCRICTVLNIISHSKFVPAFNSKKINMAKEITTLFENTINKFRAAVDAFTDSQVNSIPFEGSWTPAQVADHVLKSQARFPQLIAGKTTEANRNTIEKKEIVEKIFLDFTIKLNAPEFIIPSKEPIEKPVLLKRIDDKWEEIKTAIETNELDRLCLDFELPNLGQLTGIEWCWFQVYHTQRHTRQLLNIYNAMS